MTLCLQGRRQKMEIMKEKAPWFLTRKRPHPAKSGRLEDNYPVS